MTYWRMQQGRFTPLTLVLPSDLVYETRLEGILLAMACQTFLFFIMMIRKSLNLYAQRVRQSCEPLKQFFASLLRQPRSPILILMRIKENFVSVRKDKRCQF